MHLASTLLFTCDMGYYGLVVPKVLSINAIVTKAIFQKKSFCALHVGRNLF